MCEFWVGVLLVDLIHEFGHNKISATIQINIKCNETRDVVKIDFLHKGMPMLYFWFDMLTARPQLFLLYLMFHICYVIILE